MSGDLLRRLRLGALAVGSAALLAAMLLFADEPRSRDLLWSVGVAALVFSLVTNWLIRREAARQAEAAEPPREPDAG